MTVRARERSKPLPKKIFMPAAKRLRKAIENGASRAEIRNLTWQAQNEDEPLITAPRDSPKRRNSGGPYDPEVDENWMPSLAGAYKDMHPDEDY